MQVRRGLTAALAVLLVACSTDTTSAPSTAGPETTAVPSSSATTTTEHRHDSTTSGVPTTDGGTVDDLQALLSTADLPADAACSMGVVPVGGQTTFVVGGRLWGLDDDGAITCLADLGGRNPSWISWSPDGDEVLAGPDVLVRNDGTLQPTGYFPDNHALRWSYPTGKALIAPNAETGHLIWRNAHDSTDRIDVSFADRTTTAAYHPAGKHIAAAGIGSDGLGEGVFVASNRGANTIRIGQVDAGEVSDLTFEMNGDSIVFLHHHPDGVDEVHRYTFSTGALESVLTTAGEAVSDLVASPVDQGAIAWATGHSTLSSVISVQTSSAAAPTPVPMPPESVSRPLGWLPGQELLIARSSPPPATDAPFELWRWSGGAPTHLIDGVSAAAPRTPHGPYLELNIVVGSGFG